MRGSRTNLVKTSGELEKFNERKLRASLARSGATRAEIDHAVGAVRAELHDGITSDEVFRIARRALQRDRRPTAARYSLQRAIQQLGPSGFPFESFVASIWQHDGYRVRMGPRMQGRLVRHEVDIDASRGKDRVLVECKFRAMSDGKVDIKTALYVYARARDLLSTGFRQFWLVTNGRFTKDALKYGAGVGLRLLSWDHPKGDSLRERVDRAGLHPLTVLTTLHMTECQRLLRKGYVLCNDLQDHPAAIHDLRLSKQREQQLWDELDGLSGKPLASPEPSRRSRSVAVERVDEEPDDRRDDDDPAPAPRKRRRRGSRGGRGRRGRGRGRSKADASDTAVTSTASRARTARLPDDDADATVWPVRSRV